MQVFGGSNDDNGNYIYQVNSNSFFIVGESASNNGDVVGLNHGPSSSIGSFDQWISNVDSSGNLIWTRLLGGTSGEFGSSIIKRPNGNFLICGSASSNSGDVSGLHAWSPFGGAYDVWITEIDSMGNLLWQHCYGSTRPDNGTCILNTHDSGFVFLGNTTQGNDSDVTGGHGSDDFWLTRCDEQGNIVWAKCYGGSDDDIPGSIVETADHGFILIGITASNNGQVIGNHSLGQDIWVVKIDSLGIIQWSKCYGGTSTDGGMEIIPASDNGFYIGANVYSNDYDIQNLRGMSDFWFAKIDSVGNIEHSTCVGGLEAELISSLKRMSDGNFLIGGIKVFGTFGWADIYIAKIDSFGNIIWEQDIGGNDDDRCNFISTLDDHNFLITGFTKSTNSVFGGQHGMKDLFLMKLNESPTSVEETLEHYSTRSSYFNDELHLYFHTENLTKAELIVCNSLGQRVEGSRVCQTVYSNEIVLHLKLLPGIYFGRIISPNYNGNFKFVAN